MKLPSTYENQISKFIERGLHVEDFDEAMDVLSRMNYYSVTGYLHDFRQLDSNGKLKEEYVEGLTFNNIINIIDFDRKLRTLLLYTLEIIENNLKTKISHYFSFKYGSDGYLKKDNFKNKRSHEKTLKIFEKQKRINRDLPYIKHHSNKRDDKIPMWVAINIFNFGMVYHFYKNMKSKDQKQIADQVNTSKIILESWIETLSKTRNLAAHNMRLYNFKLAFTPRKCFNNLSDDFQPTYKIYDMFLICKIFVSKDTWNKDILGFLRMIINEYEDYIDLNSIGFPIDWEEKLTIK